jgi:transcriptional regulator with XRE-family HTH domain
MALPTGNQLKAARALAGLGSGELAALADIDPSTLSRMESSGHLPIRGQAPKVDAVITQLKARGVEITEDGVRLISKPRR